MHSFLKFKVKILANIFVVYALAITLTANQSHAWEEPTFGPEWTFTHPKLLSLDVPSILHAPSVFWLYLFALDQYYHSESFLQACPGCKVLSKAIPHPRSLEKFPMHKTHYTKVQLPGPEEFTFTITLDPGVFEVITSPATVEVFEKYRDLIQTHVFDVMAWLPRKHRLLPLRPDYLEGQGGGHKHFGVMSTFLSDGRAKSPYERGFEWKPVESLFIRNEIVDCANNPARTRVFGLDLDNAPAVADLSAASQDSFATILLAYRYQTDHIGILINSDLSETFTMKNGSPSRFENSSHYQDLNIEGYRFGTFEERAQFPQANVDEWITQIKIKRARLLWLRELSEKGIELPLKLHQATELVRKGKRNPKLFVEAYYRYLAEMNQTRLWPQVEPLFREKFRNIRCSGPLLPGLFLK